MDKDVGKLISRLSGYNRPSESAAIDALIADADDGLVERLEKELTKSQWPLCTSLGTALGRIGTPRSTQALINNLTAQKHHVRTAAINALVLSGDEAVVVHIEPLLADKAYETRVAARDAIKALTGQRVKTARGE